MNKYVFNFILFFRITARYVVKRACEWYNQIYKLMKNFKIVGVKWLPETYTLPDNLANWLDLPWFDENLEKYLFFYNAFGFISILINN